MTRCTTSFTQEVPQDRLQFVCIFWIKTGVQAMDKKGMQVKQRSRFANDALSCTSKEEV